MSRGARIAGAKQETLLAAWDGKPNLRIHQLFVSQTLPRSKQSHCVNNMLATTNTVASFRAGSRPIALLDFLVPAFGPDQTVRSFSRASRLQSRIGAAPLSIPPSVQLRLIDAPKPKKNLIAQRITPPRTLEVTGPLGKCAGMNSWFHAKSYSRNFVDRHSELHELLKWYRNKEGSIRGPRQEGTNAARDVGSVYVFNS